MMGRTLRSALFHSTQAAAVLDVAGGPADFAALGEVMRRHRLTPAA
jgi:hypothetical protein